MYRLRNILMFALALVAGVMGTSPAFSADLPSWLPRYELSVDLDIPGHQAMVSQRSTWINPTKRPTQQLVLNAHSHFVVPGKDVPLIAKTLELLRVRPQEAMGDNENPCQIHRIWWTTATGEVQDLPFHFEGDTDTTLVVELPRSVEAGQSVTVQIEYRMHLPQKQGRWGQFRDVTFLSNWTPVFAVYDGNHPPCKQGMTDTAWQPTPFIPWHQPFFNESSIFHAWVKLPADQKIACTGSIIEDKNLEDGRHEVHIEAPGVRDFAFLCSNVYREQLGEAKVATDRPPVRVHVLALPQHEFYAKEILRIAIQALEYYSKWFGPYPYKDFTIAEAFFGWNGNECATLVMIDERVFGMPHMALNYVDYLISHETCHQWWYNMVGTNGYAETWMDEALATYFSHRVLDEKLGKDITIIKYPAGLEWMPNIRRDDYRSYGMYGTFGRGDNSPPMQDMRAHGNLVTLFSNCYDKGSRILGMIQERMGDRAFMEFFRGIFVKYQYRILRVADFQHELEMFTGQSWDDFFKNWLYSKGLSDWAVADVVVSGKHCIRGLEWYQSWRQRRVGPPTLDNPQGMIPVTVIVEQKAEINEPTSLGFALKESKGYPIRVPIIPQSEAYTIPEPVARVERLGEKSWRVEVLLPEEPVQVAVDPDRIVVDRNPCNNLWKPTLKARFSPIYTFLDETDLTNPYDSWNFIFGPWMYGASYNSPWYTRATSIGGRAGIYHTAEFSGGTYMAYRTDFRDVVAGVDGFWDHWPYSHAQIGFNIEKRIATFENPADDNAVRAVLYARHVFQYSSSMYLAPMNYIEAFTSYQDNFLPFSSKTVPDAIRFDHASTVGVHYQVNYLTPYWDADAGFWFDIYYEGGVTQLNGERGMQLMSTRFSSVKALPDLIPLLDGMPTAQSWARPLLDWISATRFAFLAYGGVALPNRGEFFTLGGSSQFRGFNLSQRQGSALWGSDLELRVPIARNLTCDFFDHIMGVRNIYTALFYDIGDAYVANHSQGPVAHALGAGLRVDIAWFGFVERSMLRLDMAQCINESGTGTQFWIGFQQPF